ncbi:valine--tRNA ligase [Candidatus Saccharibacteria bacterium]|nr:valine--tRNA ligase [Candidatus Saccharibacteria bacterium]
MKFASSYEAGEYETDIYAAWESSGAFKPKKSKHFTQEGQLSPVDHTYSIVMPPPNANGNLHIGHGLTVAIEDSLIRYHRLLQDETWYIPGADHAGFETWVVYERNLEKQGHSRFEYSRDELYQNVWDFVAEQRGNMELQLRALGASCSWDDLTFTLDDKVVKRVYQTFEKMWKDGFIYRGEKLVNYCPKHQTAFADIEVEHKDEKGKLWDIAYKVIGSDQEIIVSTTRPETLFGDTAVAVNPSDERYTAIIGQSVKLPLTDREIPIIADEHADPAYGTGAVKITPAHDYDDFEVGNRHDLERIRVINDEGKMENVPDAYLGLTTEECRKKVLKDLDAQGLLRGEKKIVHSVAHCYKCGTVIEPTLKEQWFIDVEKLAGLAIRHLKKGEIKFYPENKGKVLINYLEGLKDWNISRQIPWGIPIPMFKKNPENTDENAPEWIYDTRVDEQTIEVDGVTYFRDEDTFDTWFSSSHWPIVCTNWQEGKDNPFYPLNVMETGADILFAWVARMIMMGIYVTGEVPFKEVYLHGLVLDSHGQKMSKSKGNVLNPLDLVEKYGSDAFRLGILRGRSAGLNQAFSEDSVKTGRNLCNKLWNISRFIQSLVDEDNQHILNGNKTNEGLSEDDKGFSPVNSQQSPVQATTKNYRSSEDRLNVVNSTSARRTPIKESPSLVSYATNSMGEDWICREINNARTNLMAQMRDYRFSEAVENLQSLIWDKYADWFIESQKMYKNIPLLKKTLENILVLLHPFAPFVTETIWQNLSWTEGMIINHPWPEELEYDPISAENFDRLRAAISEIRRTYQDIPGNKKYGIIFGDDSLIDDNQVLVQRLTGAPSVIAASGNPKGIRIALAGREIYLDVDEKTVKDYSNALDERILAVGRELDALNARMMNPNYVDKAPAHLVKETQDAIKEKETLINRLKKERELIA